MIAFTFIGLTLLGLNARGSDLEHKYRQEIRANTLSHHFMETGLCERIYGETDCVDCCLVSADVSFFLAGNFILGGLECENDTLCMIASIFGGIFTALGVGASTVALVCRGGKIYKEVSKQEEEAEKHRKILELIKAANFANIENGENKFHFQAKHKYCEDHLKAMIEAHQKDHDCDCTLTVSDLILRLRGAIDAGYLVPQNKLGLNGNSGTVGQWAELSDKELIIKLAEKDAGPLYESFKKAKQALFARMMAAEKNRASITAEGKDFVYTRAKKDQ
jgi:hypothetical protein